MPRGGSLFFLFILLFGCTQSVQYSKPMRPAPPSSSGPYIGLHYPPLPVGLSDQAGYLIHPEAGIEYTLSYIAAPSGEMLWLERLTHRNQSGHPFFEVRAVLELPPLSEHELLIFGQCRFGGVSDGEIVALVKENEGEVYTDIRHAWRANRRTERFETVPLDGLVCLNDSYGA